MTTDPIPLHTPPEPPVAPEGGFVLSRILKLVFEDDDLAGLEVRARSLPMGELLDLTRRAETLATANLTALTAEQRADIDAVFTVFAGRLVSWNVADERPDGSKVPVPCTVDGLMSQDFDQVVRIIQAWQTAIAGVAAPLARRSTPGGSGSSGPDPQVSDLMDLPMEPLTGALPSPAS